MIHTKKSFGILGFALTAVLTVTGCNNTTPIGDAEPAKTGQTVVSNQPVTQNSHKDMTACPPFDPEMNMCTMQYDPVCVKEKQPDGTFSYRTAGNACMACGTPAGVEYYAGECE